LEDAIAGLVRAANVGRPLLASSSPADVVARIAAQEPGCSVTAARWQDERVQLAARETGVPYLLRGGRPVPFEIRDAGGTREATVDAVRGDLLVLASIGLFALESPGKPASADQSVLRLARAAETQTLSAAFAALVAEWKKTGIQPGSRDVLLLAARRT
jgi:hypothetical protein